MAAQKPQQKQLTYVSAGLIEATVEYSQETWEGRVDFVDPTASEHGVRFCDAHVTRDGEAPRDQHRYLSIAWVIPPGGDVIVDGTLMAREDATPRVRVALLALSAAIRAAALDRVTRQATAA